MNISKYIAFAAVAAVATGAFADARNVNVDFLTVGDSTKYENGDKVKDGEWYALCWSKDGVFEGITANYGPLDPNDKVIELQTGSRNELGNIYVWYQIDVNAAPKENGKYCVIMLDTRDGDGNPAKGTTVGGKTVPEHAATVAIASASYDATVTSLGTNVGGKTTVASAGWDKPIDPATATTAKIVGIEVEDAKIVITVDGAMEGVRYNLKSGDTPTTVETYETPVKATKTTGQEIPVEKTGDDAKFFKLTHEPMAR